MKHKIIFFDIDLEGQCELDTESEDKHEAQNIIAPLLGILISESEHDFDLYEIPTYERTSTRKI